jgi:hypothetical protein
MVCYLEVSNYYNSNSFFSWFERFVIFLIMINSILLLIFDYSDRDSKHSYNWILDTISKAITITFQIEAIIKIISMGFILHPYAYLRDWWNVIDFIIVICG